MVAILLLGMPREAWAQAGVFDESTCQEVEPEKLLKDPNLAKIYLKFNAKVLAVSGDDVIIHDNEDVPLKLDEKLIHLTDELHANDNIRVFGVLSKPPRGSTVFVVKKLDKLKDDATIYRQNIDTLTKAGDAQKLYDYAKKIEGDAEKFKKGSQYKPIVREAYKAGIALRERTLKPDDADAWIALAGDHLRLLGDRQGALARLVKAIKPGEPLGKPVTDMLNALNAVLYGGEYVLFEVMKEREGFVERGGKWVLRERAAFDDAVEAQRATRSTPRKLLDDYYAAVAKSGKIELGMRKDEVATAIGFPDEVDRQRKGPDVYDAWTYEGRGTLFFENNQLFKRPDMPF